MHWKIGKLTEEQYSFIYYTEAHSCNPRCRGKEMSTAYSACVFVALVIQQAKRMRHIVICDLCVSTIFLTLSHTFQDFRKNILNIQSVIFSKHFVCKISHFKKK